MNNTVIEFEPDRRIAWQPTTLGGLVGGRIWRYELTPTGDATLVRETWDVSKDRLGAPPARRVGGRLMLKMGAMPQQAEDGIRATLARIAALVEN